MGNGHYFVKSLIGKITGFDPALSSCRPLIEYIHSVPYTPINDKL